MIDLFDSNTKPKFVVEATVIRKCQLCGDSRVRDGKYVEGACPSCGAELPDVENLGVVYDSRPIWHWKRKLKKLFGGK